MEFGERTLFLSPAAPATPTATLLGLAEVQTERTDLNEVDVTLGRPTVGSRVAVIDLGVVGDQVTRLEPELL